MKNKLLLITAGFGVVIILVTCLFYFQVPTVSNQSNNSQQIVDLNEISRLVDSGDTAKAQEKISELEKSMRSAEVFTQSNNQILLIGGVSLLFLVFVFLYFYFAVLRPFDKLQGFAENIAQGDFDVPLNYERSNYFGKFTWAFDSMRNEITKSRQCEKEAVENNKTVIATLSHDIKIPIASIHSLHLWHL